MANMEELWQPLSGQLIWSVKRAVGSFLTMEFGEPHLTIREPLSIQTHQSVRVRQILSRRRIIVVGDWHLWIQYGNWKLHTTSGFLDSESPIGSTLDECLKDLDGQRLISVGIEQAKTLVLGFDREASLEIAPSEKEDEPQWSLHRWQGDVVEQRRDGVVVYDKDTYATASA